MGFVNTRVVNNKSVLTIRPVGPRLHYTILSDRADIIIYDKYLHIIAVIHIK